MPALSSLVAPEVVVMTTYGVTSDDEVDYTAENGELHTCDTKSTFMHNKHMC